MMLTPRCSPPHSWRQRSPPQSRWWRHPVVDFRLEVNNIEEGSSSSAQRATLLFMEEGFEVIFCVLPMSSVGCPDVSDLGGGLGQAPQDGLAARWAGQVSVEADAFLHITVTREPPGQRLPSGHGVHGDRL